MVVSAGALCVAYHKVRGATKRTYRKTLSSRKYASREAAKWVQVGLWLSVALETMMLATGRISGLSFAFLSLWGWWW